MFDKAIKYKTYINNKLKHNKNFFLFNYIRCSDYYLLSHHFFLL